MSGSLDWLREPLGYAFNQRALLVALLIGFTNGYLSGFIVLRKSALMVSALSHSLLPGIAVAVLLFGLTPLSGFLGGLMAAMIIGLGALVIARGSRLDANSALAILYTTAFAAGLVILEKLPTRMELDDWLFGNILGLADSDLVSAFTMSGVILLTLTALHRPLLLALFEPSVAASQGIPVKLLQYLLMGLIVLGLVTSLQAVGCLLSVGLLVTPGATAFLFARSPSGLLWGGAVLGAVLSGSAVILAYWLDVPTGTLIIGLMGGTFALAYLLKMRGGIVARIKEGLARRAEAH